jgi:hypothetical protein
VRRHGDDFEVARAGRPAAAVDHPTPSAAATPTSAAAGLSAPRMGLGPRGTRPRGRAGRLGAPPPELLSVGVVGPTGATIGSAPAVTLPAPAAEPDVPIASAAPFVPDAVEVDAKRPARGATRRGRGRKQATKRSSRGATSDATVLQLDPSTPADSGAAESSSASRRSARTKSGAKPRRGRKTPARSGDE